MLANAYLLLLAAALFIGAVNASDSLNGQDPFENGAVTLFDPPEPSTRRLPTEEAFQASLTTRPFRHGMRTFPWLPHTVPWEPLSRPPSDQPQPHHLIPAFTRYSDGHRFGPLGIGSYRYELQPYPLDLPFFRHTYLRSDDATLIPTNFELLRAGQTTRYGDWIFRPEPEILDYIQNLIQRHLRLAGREPQLVQPDYPLKQGQMAWPPIDLLPHTERSLGMPPFIVGTHRLAVKRQLEMHARETPGVYHLEVPTYHGVRHIMMTPVPAAEFTGLRSVPRNLGFWVMHEAMVGRSERALGRTRPRYSLLGGMFLPGDAPEVLKEIMYPAYLYEH